MTPKELAEKIASLLHFDLSINFVTSHDLESLLTAALEAKELETYRNADATWQMALKVERQSSKEEAYADCAKMLDDEASRLRLFAAQVTPLEATTLALQLSVATLEVQSKAIRAKAASL